MSQKPFERLLFAFYGIATCLLEKQQNFSKLITKTYKMSHKHKKHKKKLKVMRQLGGFANSLFDSMFYDEYGDCFIDESDYEMYNTGQMKTTIKTKKYIEDTIEPTFKMCPIEN